MIGIDTGEKRESARLIFVLGTGRSGTHLLGHLLAGHPNCRVRFEEAPTFGWITQIAREPHTEERLLPLIRTELEARLLEARDREFLVEKSHPALWCAERLATEFPSAIFVGIHRKLFATVASMLAHAGIHRRVTNGAFYPRARDALGEDYPRDIEKLPLEARCALRVIAGRRELARLSNSLAGHLYVIDYEGVVSGVQIDAISGIVGTAPSQLPKIDAGSLDKWRIQLRSDQLENILAIAWRCGALDLVELA
jgi:hypothetical protein